MSDWTCQRCGEIHIWRGHDFKTWGKECRECGWVRPIKVLPMKIKAEHRTKTMFMNEDGSTHEV